jgi:hypothetical protein
MPVQPHARRVYGRGHSSPRPRPAADRRSRVDVDDAEHLSQRLQFIAVTLGDPKHCASPALREMHLDMTSVINAAVLCDEPQCDATIDERGGPMRACLQPMRQFANGGPVSFGMSNDVQQHQVLRLGKPARPRGRHAEALKSRDLVAELGKGDKLFPGQHAPDDV